MFVWDLDWVFSPITCAILFIVAAWTDWLDGYLARKLRISTVFGAFLDPVADKIMVKPGPAHAFVHFASMALVTC